MASHQRCKGRYAGCLKLAHKGAVLDMCTNCRDVHRERMAAEGKDLLGRPQRSVVKQAVLEALDDPMAMLPGYHLPSLEEQIGSVKQTIKVENVMADAGTGGHGVLTPEERFAFARDLLANAGEEVARDYLAEFNDHPGAVKSGDPRFVREDMREEIRELHRSGVASVEELSDTYLLTDRAIEWILAQEPEKETQETVTVEAPTEHPGKHTAEHMAKMREQRARKQAEKKAALDAELARLRAIEAQVATNGQVHEPLPSSVRWSVTVLRAVTETIEAPNMNLAIAEARTRFGVTDEQVIGIVRE